MNQPVEGRIELARRGLLHGKAFWSLYPTWSRSFGIHILSLIFETCSFPPTICLSCFAWGSPSCIALPRLPSERPWLSASYIAPIVSAYHRASDGADEDFVLVGTYLVSS
jgi:hypothetical protein